MDNFSALGRGMGFSKGGRDREDSGATIVATSEDEGKVEIQGEQLDTQEVQAQQHGPTASNDLRRELRPRDLNMIAFSGSVGTGLIIGAGQSLHNGGPASLMLCFLVIGFVVWSVITALGEMATMVPMKKGFAGYSTRFVDPCLGFATGWNYFFKYVILLPTNLTASGLIIQYWRPDLNVAIWVTVFGILLVLLNLFHVSTYGSAQFYMGVAKVIVIIMMIVACFVTSFGGTPNHDRIGFRYWRDEAFRGMPKYSSTGSMARLLGFWASMVQACFAYTGAEIVGASFGETPNPKKNIPNAVRLTAFRILTVYILGALAITMSVSPTSPLLLDAIQAGKKSGGASPFVIAVKEGGVKILPDIFNGCLLVFVLSAANADIYTASRTIYGLAHDVQAPKLFRYTNSKGVPWPAVLFSSLFVGLGYLNADQSAAQIFTYLVNISTVFGVLNWINILLAYFGMLRAMRAQGISRDKLPYKGYLQPFSSIFAISMTIIVIVFNGFEAFLGGFTVDKFITCYIGVVLYLFNIAFWKLYKGTKSVSPDLASLDASDESGHNGLAVAQFRPKASIEGLGQAVI